VSITIIQFETPYVVFLGDTVDAIYAKTGLVMVKWRPEECAGQMRLPRLRRELRVRIQIHCLGLSP
jgi:hypothetical protein